METIKVRDLVWTGSDDDGEWLANAAYGRYRVFQRADGMWAWQKNCEKQSASVQQSWMARAYCQEDLESAILVDTV